MVELYYHFLLALRKQMLEETLERIPFEYNRSKFFPNVFTIGLTIFTGQRGLCDFVAELLTGPIALIFLDLIS
jgi:hypothetical protein